MALHVWLRLLVQWLPPTARFAARIAAHIHLQAEVRPKHHARPPPRPRVMRRRWRQRQREQCFGLDVRRLHGGWSRARQRIQRHAWQREGGWQTLVPRGKRRNRRCNLIVLLLTGATIEVRHFIVRRYLPLRMGGTR